MVHMCIAITLSDTGDDFMLVLRDKEHHFRSIRRPELVHIIASRWREAAMARGVVTPGRRASHYFLVNVAPNLIECVLICVGTTSFDLPVQINTYEGYTYLDHHHC
jgi:hypothetical protein